MTAPHIARQRLLSQQIAASRCATAAEVVATLGAVQAQDHANALWAIGLRLPSSTETDIEQAIRNRTIVRTWPMRGTLHFVPAADVRWMLDLLTPRIIAGMASRAQQLGLDDAVFARARKTFARALNGGRQLTRAAMLEALEQAKISTASQRGYHILSRLGQEGLICFAVRSGKQPTFALLDEWIPKARRLDLDATLAELARRYFSGHGPATLKDFIWWSGLKAADARAGLDGASPRLTREVIDGVAYWMAAQPPAEPESAPAIHLLPGFDEYLLGYQDRSAVLAPEHAPLVVPGGNGMFLRTIVTRGRVTGTWKQSVKTAATVVAPASFVRLKQTEARALAVAAERYGRFLGTSIIVSDDT